MSGLEAIELGEAYKIYDDDKEFYLKSEADEVIAQFKSENESLKHSVATLDTDLAMMKMARDECERQFQAKVEEVSESLDRIAEKDEEIEELKADNERQEAIIQATKRALWLARAQRALHCANVFCFVPTTYLNTPLNIYGFADKDIGMNRMLRPCRWTKIWQKVVQLCKAKAAEY